MRAPERGGTRRERAHEPLVGAVSFLGVHTPKLRRLPVPRLSPKRGRKAESVKRTPIGASMGRTATQEPPGPTRRLDADAAPPGDRRGAGREEEERTKGRDGATTPRPKPAGWGVRGWGGEPPP